MKKGQYTRPLHTIKNPKSQISSTKSYYDTLLQLQGGVKRLFKSMI